MEDDELMAVMNNTIPSATKLYIPTNSYIYSTNVTVEDDELMTVMHNTIPTATKLMLPIAADLYKDDPGNYPLLKDDKLTTLKGILMHLRI